MDVDTADGPCMRFAVILCDMVKVALAMLADECVETG